MKVISSFKKVCDILLLHYYLIVLKHQKPPNSLVLRLGLMFGNFYIIYIDRKNIHEFEVSKTSEGAKNITSLYNRIQYEENFNKLIYYNFDMSLYEFEASHFIIDCNLYNKFADNCIAQVLNKFYLRENPSSLKLYQVLYVKNHYLFNLSNLKNGNCDNYYKIKLNSAETKKLTNGQTCLHFYIRKIFGLIQSIHVSLSKSSHLITSFLTSSKKVHIVRAKRLLSEFHKDITRTLQSNNIDTPVVYVPKEVSKFRPSLNILGLGPNIIASDKSLYRYSTQQSKGPVTTEYGRDAFDRSRGFEVGAANSFLQGSISGTQHSVALSGGWHIFISSLLYSEVEQEVSFAVAAGDYAIMVDRSKARQATAAEILARGLQLGALIDFVDRNLGFRINVRNFGISVQHDFDDYFNVVDSGFGTQLMVTYRGASLALANDMREKRAGVAVGVRNYNIALLHDFDQFATVAQANWGRGWQLAVEFDFPDEFSVANFATIGLGRLDRAFIQAGAGIGEDGIGQATARLQGRNAGIGADLLDEFNNRLLQLSFTVGRTTYVWQSSLNFQNIKIPNFISLKPNGIKNFLSSLHRA